jgi:hypothetical protein
MNKLLLIFSVFFIFIVGIVFFINKNKENLCFYNHLTEAIKVNQSRKEFYSEKTNKESEKISNMLINNERLAAPLALVIDLLAQQYINAGIPVVCGDFVSMEKILPPTTIPTRNESATNSDFNELKLLLSDTKNKMYSDTKLNNFEGVSSQAYVLLGKIKVLENKTSSDFCMSKHVVESIGFGALHANSYSELTSGKINWLEKLFLNTSISGLSNSIVDIDIEAQKIHTKNVGIICNDVPHIPFEEEYLQNK